MHDDDWICCGDATALIKAASRLPPQLLLL
jgi:hypothetical protein